MLTQTVDLADPVLGFTQSWINGLARQVGELHVVALHAGERELAPNVQLYAAEATSRGERLGFFRSQLRRLVSGGAVDVVFVHMIPRWVLMAAPYTLPARTPVVLWYTHQTISWQLQVAHRLATQVVTAAPEGYPLWGSGKATAIGHGVDTDYFRPAPQATDHDELRVLSVGRLSTLKRYEVLIEAARLLVQEQGMERLCVRIVGGPAAPGDEAYLARLEAQTAAAGLQAHVTFAGAIPFDQLLGEYQAADLFVNCKVSSMDKVVLEAAACAVPVLAASPAFAPLGEAAQTPGVFPADDAAALAEQIACYGRLEPAARREIGLRLAAVVEQEHSVHRLMEKLADTLNRTAMGESK
jgi:glycosyltransferase involved in cell wall biosynthesis